jgi:plasmid stabilization system protein ParE
MGVRKARLLRSFGKDIDEVMAWSETHFGLPAADRYGALIRQAMRDLRTKPDRAGSQTLEQLKPGARVYHLRFSKDRVAGGWVAAPRHIIVYRYTHDLVEFVRLLHESRDLERHLPSGYKAT